MVGLYSFRETTSACWSPREWVGGACERAPGFARAPCVIYGSGAALCVTQLLPAQMLGLGVDSVEEITKGDSQLSVSQLQQMQRLEEQVLVSCLLL